MIVSRTIRLLLTGACSWLMTHSLSAEVRVVWQTLHDYTTIVEPAHNGRQDRHQVNPFLSYTNIGTDFGFLGPAESQIGWQSGQIGVTLGNSVNDWAGMWHSLARLARMKEATLDFSACYPKAILPQFQPKIRGLRVLIRGRGRFKIELSNSNNQVLWSQLRTIDQDQFRELLYHIPTSSLKQVKYLNWVVEPGADLDIDRIDFQITTPDVTFDQWLFLTSYAKSLTCWSDQTGTVRDRAHIDDGSFDSVSATGLFCLATAAAAQEKIVTPEFAAQIWEKSQSVMDRLRGPYGLLPHFIRKNLAGEMEIHPGTEYSTIDTALYDLSTIIAAKMMGRDDLMDRAIQNAKKVEMERLIVQEQYISHGVMHDGRTIIPYYWKDWGGETALVCLMQKLRHPDIKVGMSSIARPHQGTGFIAEIQSLLFQDFERTEPDAISGANWQSVRMTLLEDQQKYFPQNNITSALVKHGVYGLSAGEQRHGLGYIVCGVDLPQQSLVHPHYMLMSAALYRDPTALRRSFQWMEQQRILGAWGLVENIHAIDQITLPMIGSLNATFEALGAYHFYAKHHHQSNAIYRASQSVPELQKAMRSFYP